MAHQKSSSLHLQASRSVDTSLGGHFHRGLMRHMQHRRCAAAAEEEELCCSSSASHMAYKPDQTVSGLVHCIAPRDIKEMPLVCY